MDEQREGEEKVIDISEEGESKDNTLYFHDAQKHADESRRVIAYSLVGLLIFTYVLSILSYILGYINTDEFNTIYHSIDSNMATFIAAVIGFYFGKNGK